MPRRGGLRTGSIAEASWPGDGRSNAIPSRPVRPGHTPRHTVTQAGERRGETQGSRMHITVLERGGFSVFGGSYDPRKDCVIANTRQQQVVTIDFPEDISAVTLTNNGLTLGSATTDDNVATFTLSGHGSCLVTATMGSERPAVRIETPRQDTNDYGAS